jgi:hypothetical protein
MATMRKLPVVLIYRRPTVLPNTPNQPHIRSVPPRYEGRFAIVTNVECGMRWTLWRRKTSDASADGEAVWS